MKTIITLLFLFISIWATVLPQTLAGIAPGEQTEAYLGSLGFPSIEIAEGSDRLLSWGDGLLIRVDKDNLILEVIITRPGRQQELGFDVGDELDKARDFFQQFSQKSEETDKESIWIDEVNGLKLTANLGQDRKIVRLVLSRY